MLKDFKRLHLDFFSTLWAKFHSQCERFLSSFTFVLYIVAHDVEGKCKNLQYVCVWIFSQILDIAQRWDLPVICPVSHKWKNNKSSILIFFALKGLFLNISYLIRGTLGKNNSFWITLKHFTVTIWSKTCKFCAKWPSLRAFFSKNRKLPKKSIIFPIKIPSKFLKKCFLFKSHGVWAEIFHILQRGLLLAFTSKTKINFHMYKLQTLLLRSKE